MCVYGGGGYRCGCGYVLMLHTYSKALTQQCPVDVTIVQFFRESANILEARLATL